MGTVYAPRTSAAMAHSTEAPRQSRRCERSAPKRMHCRKPLCRREFDTMDRMQIGGTRKCLARFFA